MTKYTPSSSTTALSTPMTTPMSSVSALSNTGQERRGMLMAMGSSSLHTTVESLRWQSSRSPGDRLLLARASSNTTASNSLSSLNMLFGGGDKANQSRGKDSSPERSMADEEAIRIALRQPKKTKEQEEQENEEENEKRKKEPEYETFEDEIADIIPKFKSYALALLALPLTFWPFIVGILVITALTVILGDGSFGGRAPPMD
eukprot:CAMPEP_0114494194 /NCGR_PEP_ID=MMETSP0109-20121206/4520_1 /TAXON_ID=29199 /ORGANISM="Chlorarachnion reptans, Strain CCCM449" /LENGTH=202 /DNA_ID=CAMNT_0001671211 /DNA_START=221 /DNA_END=829 /DNA_ORIENTATION=-